MKIIIGNWKMNGSSEQMAEMMTAISETTTAARVFLCVPYTMLHGGTAAVIIGAQNVSKYESGAHTGEISAEMVSATGAHATLVGHSECRETLHDTNADVAMRASQAIKHDLIPIICIGETATERDTGLTNEILMSGVRQCVPENATNGGFIIAYEPRWAIGAGKTASIEQIASAHKIIRETLNEMGFDETPIVYGGSVTANNVAEITSIENTDGVLIGGASLKIDDFIPIIKSVK